jgi:hypothetical protein
MSAMGAALQVQQYGGTGSMKSIRIREKVSPDGSLVITGIPFQPGEEVEINIKSLPKERTGKDPYSLRGSVLKYDHPFEPAAPPEDWDAISGRGMELYLEEAPREDSDSAEW